MSLWKRLTWFAVVGVAIVVAFGVLVSWDDLSSEFVSGNGDKLIPIALSSLLLPKFYRLPYYSPEKVSWDLTSNYACLLLL